MEKINNQRNSTLGSLLGTASQKSQIKKPTAHTSKSSSARKKNSTNSFETILTENTSATEVMDLVDEHGVIDETKLSELQDDIHEAGEILLEKPGIDAVLAYRKKVQVLLASVTPLLHRKEQYVSRKRIGNSFEERKYTLIHTVHQKLDRLLQIVMSSQVQQMSIMKALDEIRGLIVNILH